MKATIQAKINNRKRVPLQEVIPLKYPFSIQIDIADACNMLCNFCFHSDLDAIKEAQVKFGLMKYEVFQKIIDDIAKCWGREKEIKKLRLFALGEPLLNKDLIKMISYAKKS